MMMVFTHTRITHYHYLRALTRVVSLWLRFDVSGYHPEFYTLLLKPPRFLIDGYPVYATSCCSGIQLNPVLGVSLTLKGAIWGG